MDVIEALYCIIIFNKKSIPTIPIDCNALNLFLIYKGGLHFDYP